jgi:type I restriction enzyme S subunit
MNRSSKTLDWQRVTFDEAFADITAKANKVDQSEFLSSGKYPIVDQGQHFIAGFTDNEELVWGDDLPVVIFGDHTRILKYVDFPFVLGADGTKVLKPNKDILPLFAYYQLLSVDIPSAGYSRHFKFLKDFSFQYPSLIEQKRIASLLARADRLRAMRRKAHELGESLLQSVFLEMFGDPQFNNKKWDLVTLGDKITFMTSGSRGWAEYYSEKGDLFLRIQNVGANQLLLDDVAFVQAPDTAESKRTKVQPGDLLISATADLGRTTVIPEYFPTAYINQHLFLLRLKDLNPVFAAGYFSTTSGKAQILRLDREGVKSGLNFDDARSLTVFNPPLSLQEQFAGVVRRVESLRGRMSEAERQVQGLFESLLAQSFGGQ